MSVEPSFLITIVELAQCKSSFWFGNMRSTNFVLILLAVSLLAFSGCGSGDFAPVSGTVTSDGRPVPKLRVVLSPMPIGDDHSVGPFSMGVTDDEGKFTLKTRYGDSGAFVGMHKASFEYTDIGEDAMGDLRDQLADAKEEQDSEAYKKAQQKMKKMIEKLKGRPVLMNRYTASITIPKNGTETLNIELTEMGGQ